MEKFLMTLGSVLPPHSVPSIYPVAQKPSKNKLTNLLIKLVLLTVFLYVMFLCIHMYIK